MFGLFKLFKKQPLPRVFVYPCPVCGYADNEWSEEVPDMSYDICAQCGVEFGLDDVSKTWEDLRHEWIAKGQPFEHPI